ncbi:MAG: nuclear transport factor 2 family protein [Thermoleophilaceae bacterium]
MRDVVVTHVRRRGSPRRSRNLEERLFVRFPALYRRPAALVARLSPRSRLRRTLLRREVVSGWHATSRQDFELVVVRYADDVEIKFDAAFEAIGLAGPFRGHQGILERERTFQEEWQRWEAVPMTVLDLGERLVVLGEVRLAGKASGLELEREVAQLMTSRDGLVVRDEIVMGWDKGLRAAGLDPEALDRGRRG